MDFMQTLYGSKFKNRINLACAPIDVEVQEQRPWDVIYLSSVNHTLQCPKNHMLDPFDKFLCHLKD